jgi:hypothetical protein
MQEEADIFEVFPKASLFKNEDKKPAPPAPEKIILEITPHYKIKALVTSRYGAGELAL